MPSLDDFLKAGSVPLVGLGIIGLAIPLLLPGLRPQLATVVKAAAKLFLEAELGADNELTDRLVDTAIGALVSASSYGSDAHRTQEAERQVNRFVSAARVAAHRRGWDEQDIERRYHRHLSKMDAALSRASHRAHPSQRAALGHAHEMLEQHRAKRQPHAKARRGDANRDARSAVGANHANPA